MGSQCGVISHQNWSVTRTVADYQNISMRVDRSCRSIQFKLKTRVSFGAGKVIEIPVTALNAFSAALLNFRLLHEITWGLVIYPLPSNLYVT